MKRRIGFGLFVIAVLVLVRVCITLIRTNMAGTPTGTGAAESATFPTAATPTLFDPWQTLPDVPLVCREIAHDGPYWRHWPGTAISVFFDADFSSVGPGKLVTDGDFLWVATPQGLVRLNVYTFECSVFTSVGGGISLANARLLLPDGEGGLWAVVEQGLLRFSAGRWQAVSSEGGIIGLHRSGRWCVQYKTNMRNAYVVHYCVGVDTIPQSIDTPNVSWDTLDCRQWQRMADGVHTYVTPAGCERLAAHVAQEGSLVAVSASGDEVWEARESSSGARRLFRWRGESVEGGDVPYRSVYALAADPAHDGVWMMTETGLVRARVKEAGEGERALGRYVFQRLSFKPGIALGDVLALAVDQADQVWAVTGRSVLRYDAPDRTWRPLLTVPDSAGLIAADPVRGVWVATRRGELLHLDGIQQQTWSVPGGPMGIYSENGHVRPTALLVDQDGRVWMGTSESGVWTARPAAQSPGDAPPVLNWRRFTVQDGLASESITALARGPDGRIYAAHRAGISVLGLTGETEAGRWSLLPGSDVGGEEWVDALAFAPAQAGGALWAAYYPGGLLRRYEGGRWTDYGFPTGHSRVAGVLLVDDGGTPWIGTTEGVWRWSAAPEDERLRWQTFDLVPYGFSIRNVRALSQGPGSGSKVPGSGDKVPGSGGRDAGGRMWVGSQGGLTVITPTQINRWRTPPLSLNCREHTHDGLAWQNWRNVPMTETVISGVNSNGLAADGDLLWGATDYGLVRLDTRTWECDVFTEVAGIPLKYVDTLLPDGEGGLWVGTDQGLLRFSAGKWRMALPPVDGFSPTALGLHQNGELHVEMGYGRSGAILDADTLSVIETHDYSERPWLLDFTDCSRWQRLSTWHVARGEAYSHLTQVGYVTQAGCEQIARQITSVRLNSTFVAASAEGDETWTAETRPLQPTWLTRRRDEAVEVVGIPHQTILALTLGRDVWLATRDELVRGVRVADKGGSIFVFQPLALNAEVFPGSVRSLAVNKAGGVWAVNGDSVLRYDEPDHAWRRVISATHSADAIAADPLRGVWVAGRGELTRVTQEQQRTWPLPDVITGTPTALLVGENGRLWLGTLQDGVWTAVPSAASAGNEPSALDWHQSTAQNGLADEFITALAFGRGGRVYAGHHEGVSVFGPTAAGASCSAVGVACRWTTLPGSGATDGKGWVNALAWNEGRLWVGYFNDAALRSYENGRWTDYVLPSAMHGVSALLVDDGGALWVGTTEGLWRWPDAGNGEPRWQRLSPGSLVLQDVLALVQAPSGGDKNAEGRVWVGGREGIAVSGRPP